jgi:hypothetical protein
MSSSNFSIDSTSCNPFKTGDRVDKAPSGFVTDDNDGDHDTYSTTEEEEDQFQCRSSFNTDPFAVMKVKQHNPKTHGIFSDEAPPGGTPQFQKSKTTPREIFFDPNNSEALILPGRETFIDQQQRPIKHNDDHHNMLQQATGTSPSPNKDSCRPLKKAVDRWQENPGSYNVISKPHDPDHIGTLNPPKKDTMPYSPRRVVSRMTKLPTVFSSPPLTHNHSVDGIAVEGKLSLIQEILGIVSNDSDELKTPRWGRKKDDTSSNNGQRRSRSTSRGRIKDEAAIRHGRRRSRSSSRGRVTVDEATSIRHSSGRSRSSSRRRIKVDEASSCRRGRKTTNNLATSSSHDESVSRKLPSKSEVTNTVGAIDHPTSPVKIGTVSGSSNELQDIFPGGVSPRSDQNRSAAAPPVPPSSPSRRPPQQQSRVRRARSDTANPATMPTRSPRAFRGRRVVSGDLTGLQVALSDDIRKEASNGRANHEVSHTTVDQLSPSGGPKKSSSGRRRSRSRSRQDRRREGV